MTAYWVADALLERLAEASSQPSAANLPGWDPGLEGVSDWYRDELAVPGPGRNLTGLQDIVLELAGSGFAREVLRRLAPGDALWAWQERQEAER